MHSDALEIINKPFCSDTTDVNVSEEVECDDFIPRRNRSLGKEASPKIKAFMP